MTDKKWRNHLLKFRFVFFVSVIVFFCLLFFCCFLLVCLFVSPRFCFSAYMMQLRPPANALLSCCMIAFAQENGKTTCWTHCLYLFPTCQVRVVRFYVSLPGPPPPRPPPRPLPRPPAQLRLAIHSVLCRTSTTTIHAQCSLPDLNHDHPRPVFPAGPQPRPSTPSVPCRTSTTTIHAQGSLPDLNHDHPPPVFPAGPQPRPSTPSVPCRTSTASIHAKCSLPDLI